MLRLIQKDWPGRLESTAGAAALTLFGGSVGAGMLCLLVGLDETACRWLPLGTLTGLAIMLLAMVVFFAVRFPVQYRLALSMGQRRRDCIGAQLLHAFLSVLVCCGVAWLIYQAEELVYPRLYPRLESMEVEAGMAAIFSWQAVLGVAAAAAVVSFFVGALCARYGKKAGVTLYLLFLAGCLGFPRLAECIDSESGNLVSRVWFCLAGLPAGAQLTLAAAVLLALLAVAVRAAMRQEVRL